MDKYEINERIAIMQDSDIDFCDAWNNTVPPRIHCGNIMDGLSELKPKTKGETWNYISKYLNDNVQKRFHDLTIQHVKSTLMVRASGKAKEK